jgi:DNA-binding NtrC family response regulator
MAADRPDAFDDASTVARTRFQLTPAAEGSFHLRVIEGPDQGTSLSLDGTYPSRLLVGKGPACDLRLSDPEASRRHLALELVGRRMRVTDLDSTNGTWVDGVAVQDGFVSGGEILRVGGTAIAVEWHPGGGGHELAATTRFGRVLGASTEMRRLYPLCERIAASTVPVVIEGETGTGKEALAEAIHELGPRAEGPFVVFDCTAIPPNLVESELFGHERGSFTGAVGMRKGVFEQAHGGTLLIDEIGDLDIALQPKLLRAIERSEIRRVGADHAFRVDVRVLSATRRDLDREVQEGRFRDDLYHRLAVARIELPPLRRRKGDVSQLVRHFAAQLGGRIPIPNAVIMRWEAYGWPGNVRELRNAVARYLAFGELADEASRAADAADAAEEPGDFLEHVLSSKLPFTQARDQVLEEFERRYVQRALSENDDSVVKAAAASGIARRYFHIIKARAIK